MTIAEIKKNIEALRAKRQQFVDELGEHEQDLKTLQGDRAACRRKAHLGNDGKAKAELPQIDSKIDACKSSIQDAKDTITEIEVDLASAEQALAVAEWRRARESLFKMLQARAEGKIEARILDLLAQIRQALNDASTSDAALVDAMKQFDVRMAIEAKQIARLEVLRSDYVACGLRDLVPIMLNPAYCNMLKKSDLRRASTERIDGWLESLTILRHPSEEVSDTESENSVLSASE